MSDLPPPPGAAPPPPPPSAPPPPPPSPAVHGSARYRVLPLVPPLLAALAANVVLQVILQVLAPGRTDTARDLLAGRITEAEFDDQAGAASGLNAVSQLSFAVAAVLTILLLYRVLTNLRALGRETTWSPLWAVFGWVLPPAVFVLPALVTTEAWKASGPGDGRSWRSGRANPLVIAWCVAYSAGTLLVGIATARSTFEGMDFSDPDASFTALDEAQLMVDTASAQLAGGVLYVVAGALWIVIVRQLAARHAALTGEA